MGEVLSYLLTVDDIEGYEDVSAAMEANDTSDGPH